MYQRVAISEPAKPRPTRERVKVPSPRHGPPWLALTRGREDRISTAQAKRDSQERETGARGRSHREVNMRFSDEVIASYLNDEWRTSPDVHRLLNNRGNDYDIAYALERLARQGQIECKHEAKMAPRYRDKSGPPVLCINYYRKLQRGRLIPQPSTQRRPLDPQPGPRSRGG